MHCDGDVSFNVAVVVNALHSVAFVQTMQRASRKNINNEVTALQIYLSSQINMSTEDRYTIKKYRCKQCDI